MGIVIQNFIIPFFLDTLSDWVNEINISATERSKRLVRAKLIASEIKDLEYHVDQFIKSLDQIKPDAEVKMLIIIKEKVESIFKNIKRSSV